jgi:MtN3 and saliva related transmembrane protein
VIEYIGYLAAFLGTIGWLPQVYKTWTTRETKALSLSTNVLILATVTLWFVYGVILGAWPLIIANIFAILLVGSIVVAKLIYK